MRWVNPQLEDGYTRIANEILDQIMKVSLNGTQFRLILAIWRYTYGYQRKGHYLSIRFLAKVIGASRSQVERELSALIDRKIVKVLETGNRGRMLGFNKNYTEWEDCPPRRGLSSNQGTLLSPTLGTDVSPTSGTNKEKYKEKNKESIYVEIINYLNQKTGKRFSPKSEANRKLINGRLREGRTIDDFKYVIDVKCDHWLNDQKMSEYLRPSTLFSQKNFENYLNQKPRNQVQSAPDPRDKEIAFQRWLAEGRDPDEFDWT